MSMDLLRRGWARVSGKHLDDAHEELHSTSRWSREQICALVHAGLKRHNNSDAAIERIERSAKMLDEQDAARARLKSVHG